MNTQVLGISVDSVPSLTAWAKSLEGITYPLLSDFYPHGEVAQRYGVLLEDGRSERALFIIDKEGIVQYVDVHDIDDQPDNWELFRVLTELEPEAAAAWGGSPTRGRARANRRCSDVLHVMVPRLQAGACLPGRTRHRIRRGKHLHRPGCRRTCTRLGKRQ